MKINFKKKCFPFIAASYDGRIFQWIEFRFIKYFFKKYTSKYSLVFFHSLSLFLSSSSLLKEKGYLSIKKKSDELQIFLLHLPQQQFFILLHSGILKINFMFYYPSSLFILSLIILCQSFFSPAKAVEIMWGVFPANAVFFCAQFFCF